MLNNRLAVAALATVLVLAVGGYALSRLTASGPGGPAPTPSPISTATPLLSPAASRSPALAVLTPSDVGQGLDAGTYRVEGFAAPFTVTLPTDWIVSGFGENNIAFERDDGSNINLYLIVLDKVYADPCQTTDGPSPIGTGVDALVDAFSSMPGFVVTDVEDATVGGARGKSFAIANSIDVGEAGCTGDMLPLGTYDENGEDVDVPMFGGEKDRFWVVDAAGTRVLIAVTDAPAIVAAAKPVLDSVVFGSGSTN